VRLLVFVSAAAPSWSPTSKRFVNGDASGRPLGASGGGNSNAGNGTGGFISPPSILRKPAVAMRYPGGGGSARGAVDDAGRSLSPMRTKTLRGFNSRLNPHDGGHGSGAMTPVRAAFSSTLMTPTRGTPGFNASSPLGLLSTGHTHADFAHPFPMFSPDGVGEHHVHASRACSLCRLCFAFAVCARDRCNDRQQW
jgi:hypothetical protein